MLLRPAADADAYELDDVQYWPAGEAVSGAGALNSV